MKLLLVHVAHDGEIIEKLRYFFISSNKNLMFDKAEDTEDAISIMSSGIDYDCVLATTRSAYDLPFKMRRNKINIPVIMLCRRDDASFRANVLNSGADECLIMPVSAEELAARIESVVRRYEDRSSNTVVIGKMHLDLETECVYYDDKFVKLTRRQYQIFSLLARRKGEILAKERIIGFIYNIDEGPSQKCIDTFVCYIRKTFRKLGEPNVIKTIHGRGFQIGELDGKLNGTSVRSSDLP